MCPKTRLKYEKVKLMNWSIIFHTSLLLLQVFTGGVGDQEEESLQGEDPGLYGH